MSGQLDQAQPTPPERAQAGSRSRPTATFEYVEMPDPWEKQLILSSVSLKRLSGEGKTLGYASGCLVDYGSLRFVLSVAHATRNPGIWAIALHNEGSGSRVFPVESWNFLSRVPIEELKRMLHTGTVEDLSKDIVDFCYGVVPSDLLPIHEEIRDNGDLVWSAPKTVFKTNLEIMPEPGLRYGFAGNVKLDEFPHLTDPNASIICGPYAIHGDLTYLRTENDLHYFKLAGQHPGHDYFEGCSGAPIINERGEIVALVKGGTLGDDTVHGVSLQTYKAALSAIVKGIFTT